MRPPKKLIEGQAQISASEMNRTVEIIDRLNEGQPGGNLGLDSAGGALTDLSPPSIWIKITSGSNPYVWQEVRPDPDPPGSIVPGTFVAAPSGREGSLKRDAAGNFIDQPAYEVGGATNVPAGTIIKASWGATMERWEFSYQTETFAKLPVRFLVATSFGFTMTRTGNRLRNATAGTTWGTIDGVTPAKGDRFLFADNAVSANVDYGIYAVTQLGDAAQTITGATNATPIVLTVAGHGYATDDEVSVASVGGNTAANGNFVITKIDADTFSLNGSAGTGLSSGNYTGGGTVYRPILADRATDSDTSGKMKAAHSLWVEEGTSHADSLWECTTNNPITLNTTALGYKKMAPAAAASGVGPGTLNQVARFTPNETSVGDSTITDDGTTVSITKRLVPSLVGNSLISGPTHNFDVGDTIWVGANAIGAGPWELTGITNGTSNRLLILFLTQGSLNNMVVKHQNPGSTPANQFSCPALVDLTMSPGTFVILRWESPQAGWRVYKSAT